VTARLSPFRVMLYTAAVLVVLALAFLVSKVGSVLIVVVLSIILAAAIEPIVYRLRRHGLGRGQAILVVYVGLLLAIGFGFYAILPPVVRQGGALIENIPSILNSLEDQAQVSENRFIRETGTATVQRVQQFYRDTQESPPVGGATAFQLVTSAFGLLFTFITTLILGFYWLTEKAIIKRLFLGLLPPRHRGRAHGIWDNVEAKLGGWTRGQLVLCLSIGLASAMAYSPLFLDLPFWLALALWSGITELIPFIGPWLGGAAAAVVALTQSFEVAILVVVFVVVLQQIEGAWLVPKVMKNAVGLTPLTVIVAVQVGGAIGGAIGAILAIPIAGACQVVVQDLLATRKESLDFGDRRSRPTLAALAGTDPLTAASRDWLTTATATVGRDDGRSLASAEKSAQAVARKASRHLGSAVNREGEVRPTSTPPSPGPRPLGVRRVGQDARRGSIGEPRTNPAD
jgi:predicted PurR-regulated permease PerM